MQADKSNKILIIMRGLPGSGKSTKAKQLAKQQGIIYSTDDFFIVNGKFQYDAKMIPQYHKRNYQRAQKSMMQGKSLIIIDNTNMKLWQMKKYVIAGQQYGYQIKIIQPDTPWAFNPRQCAKKNAHGVSEDKIRQMLNNYEIFNNIEQIKTSQMKKRLQK